jgi:hypothetical protein
VKLPRKLLIAVPLVVGLILVGIFMPARQVTIEGFGTLSFETAVTLTVGSEAAYASPDWLSGWTYRRPINLSQVTPVDDYQVLVTLTTSTMGNPYANVKLDGSDIRFTGSDEVTLQDYWIESWNNTGTSRIWVEVKDSPTSTIYMYYGNAAASSASDGEATFVFFDDFSTNTLADYDQAKWVDVHGDGYTAPAYDAANQRVTFDTGDDHASDIYPIGLTMDDFSMEVDFWANASYPTDATIALVGRLQNPGASSTHYYLDFSHSSYDSPGITVDSWSNGERSNTVYSEASDYYWSFNQVHTFRYAFFGDNQKFWWDKDPTQTPDVSISDTAYTSAGRLGLVAAQVRGWWDNFRVRQYLEPEPVATVGSEEPDISNTPSSKNFGTVLEDSDYWSNDGAPTFPLDDGECYFTVTNNSSAAVNIQIKATDFAGGVGWTLTSGSPGQNTVRMKAGKSGDSTEGDMVTLTNSDQDFISGLAASASKPWELKLETGTFTDVAEKTSTITLTASLA